VLARGAWGSEQEPSHYVQAFIYPPNRFLIELRII
jgi:hypothetical protein